MTPAPDWPAFDWLIAPLDRATFLEEVWERRPQAIHRADPGYFCSLVGRADSTRSPGRSVCDRWRRTNSCRSSRGPFHRRRAAERAVVADADGSPNLYQLYRSYAAGWSLILASLSERWSPITSLCARLETALHHPMTARLYLTPPEAQGFPAHHDTVDVFIVQVEGTKAWRVYPPITSSLRSMPRSTTSPFGGPRPGRGSTQAMCCMCPVAGSTRQRTSAVPSLHVTLVSRSHVGRIF